MNRFLLTLLALAFSLQTVAQDAAAYMKQLVAGNRVSFTYNVNGLGKTPLKLDGKLVVDGDCYRIEGNGLVIVCDGVSKWTVDTVAKEVYVESSEGTRDFLADPSAWTDNVKDLKLSGSVLTGTFEQDGSEMGFKFSSIKAEPLSGSTEGFVYDVSSLGKDWVVTDLR